MPNVPSAISWLGLPADVAFDKAGAGLHFAGFPPDLPE